MIHPGAKSEASAAAGDGFLKESGRALGTGREKSAGIGFAGSQPSVEIPRNMRQACKPLVQL